MADIAARVVEVDAEDTVAARRALLEDAAVLSVAQLGTRLHVLLDPATAHARRALCRAACVTPAWPAQAIVVAASLEDVFVAATGFRRTQPRGGAGRA